MANCGGNGTLSLLAEFTRSLGGAWGGKGTLPPADPTFPEEEEEGVVGVFTRAACAGKGALFTVLSPNPVLPDDEEDGAAGVLDRGICGNEEALLFTDSPYSALPEDADDGAVGVLTRVTCGGKGDLPPVVFIDPDCVEEEAEDIGTALERLGATGVVECSV